MNQYEMGLVVSAQLEEDAQKAELEKVSDLITRYGGTIEKVDNWGRRKLAYPIQKQHDGIYSFITFTSEGGVPAEVENRIRIMENVLRFLVIRIGE